MGLSSSCVLATVLNPSAVRNEQKILYRYAYVSHLSQA
uniref:Uncharacterized protein n=1 Tax=Anguilla anguilla TaxID=7936 RepID=A0A0E9X9V3_ANGAN